MIVDTSALMAIVCDEQGVEDIVVALAGEPGLLPSPALVEFRRVCSRKSSSHVKKGEIILADLLARELAILTFTAAHAEAASDANGRYGIGVARGGTLNLLDLMIYACAKVERRPILCTGRDFAATDAALHPASRA